jgi:hypothetical protein
MKEEKENLKTPIILTSRRKPLEQGKKKENVANGPVL